GLPADSKVTLANGEFAKISIDVATSTATIAAAAACGGDTANLCGPISASNVAASAGTSIFLSRAAATGAGSYLQRLYMSASENGDVKIQPRGPQLTPDSYRIPGDQAAAAYPEAGTKYVVY